MLDIVRQYPSSHLPCKSACLDYYSVSYGHVQTNKIQFFENPFCGKGID